MMPMHCTTFTPEHIVALDASRGETLPRPGVSSVGLTCWDAEGPVCCFGIAAPWPGLGIAWCEERDQDSMRRERVRIGLAIGRAWRRWTSEGAYRRIESYVPEGHEAARLLVTWLGFYCLARKPQYGRQGETVLEYVWYPAERKA